MTPEQLLERVLPRLQARPLLLLLDVDGTLSPIAPRPEDAVVSDATRTALGRLTVSPDVRVALVSGRGARDAARLVGVPGVWAIGNHGIERLSPAGELTVDPVAEPHRESIAAAAGDMQPVLVQFPGAHLEDKTWTLSVHYRGAAPGVEEPLRAAVDRIAAARGLRLTSGKKVLELRPPVTIDKGTASRAFADAVLGGGGSVLYAGDDRTDEDAFTALRAVRPSAVTLRVAPGPNEAPIETQAEFMVLDVATMGAFLELLATEVGTAVGRTG